MHKNNSRDIEILEKYLNGKSATDIANEYELGPSRVYQVLVSGCRRVNFILARKNLPVAAVKSYCPSSVILRHKDFWLEALDVYKKFVGDTPIVRRESPIAHLRLAQHRVERTLSPFFNTVGELLDAIEKKGEDFLIPGFGTTGKQQLEKNLRSHGFEVKMLFPKKSIHDTLKLTLRYLEEPASLSKEDYSKLVESVRFHANKTHL